MWWSSTGSSKHRSIDGWEVEICGIESFVVRENHALLRGTETIRYLLECKNLRFIEVFGLALRMLNNGQRRKPNIWHANYTYSTRQEGREWQGRSRRNGWVVIQTLTPTWEITRRGCLVLGAVIIPQDDCPHGCTRSRRGRRLPRAARAAQIEGFGGGVELSHLGATVGVRPDGLRFPAAVTG